MNTYNKEYFIYQKIIGSKNRNIANRFDEYISPNSVVLDFGCGGGYLLDCLNCKHKIGIDINVKALSSAKKKGIKTYTNLKFINDESVDL
jgi:2-polyprenyl-3-methyl-5-hydroxy-6-metoxy-1,4-benzoquinol methylase